MSVDSNKELVKIINKSPVIVFLWKNSEGRPVEFVSDNIREFGYEPNEFMSGKILYGDIIHPDDIERVRNETKSLVHSGISEFNLEYRIFTKNKNICWIDDRTLIRRNEKGRITHYQGIVLDITKRKELEQKIGESEQKYRKAYEKENFYKDLFTHDMRNILQGILNTLELYQLREETKEKNKFFKDLINDMHLQISRGTRLIKNVRKISEIEDTNKKLTKVNLISKIKDASRDFKESANIKNVNVTLNSFNEELYILADDLIDFVINNILLNAVIHNDNELVEIHVEISQYQENSRHYIKIEFIDNGKGIPDYKKEIIFNRDFSKEKSTIGMGLGLSLVKKVLDGYKASIIIEDKDPSDYSRGSKFIITFPRV